MVMLVCAAGVRIGGLVRDLGCLGYGLISGLVHGRPRRIGLGNSGLAVIFIVRVIRFRRLLVRLLFGLVMLID